MNETDRFTRLQKLKCLQKEENLRTNTFTKCLLTSLKNSKDSGFATKKYSLGLRTKN